jgi:hypothetical protein
MDSNANWTSGAGRDRSPEPDADLAALFHSLRPRSEELPPVADLRAQVEARLEAEHERRRRPRDAAWWKGWLEMIWNPARWTSLRLAGAVSLLLLVLACTVPLDYDRDAGLALRIDVTGDLEPVLRVLRQGPWSVENLNVEEEAGHSRVQALLRDASPEDLALFEGLAGVDVSSEPWQEESRGSLFSMMMDEVFHVRLDISGMSDEQINTALQEQLDAQGYPGQVTITRGEEDGLPLVHVELESDSASPAPLAISLTSRQDSVVTEGEWELHGGDLPPLDIQGLEDLSEEEIRQRVLEQLRAAGVPVDSMAVRVQRNGDESQDGTVRREDLRIQIQQGAPRP